MKSCLRSLVLAIPGVIMIAALGSCTDATPVSIAPLDHPEIGDHVTPLVAAALDRNGRFHAEELYGTLSADEITSAHARDLAVAFLRAHAPGLKRILENDHGGPVDPHALAPCGRVYYAESPYGPLDDEIPVRYRRIFGAWWLVTFCGQGGVRQASIAVATRSTTEIDEHGRLLHKPFEQSFNFQLLGIPRTLGALPAEPENAIAAVGALTGRRIAGVPRLLAPALGQYPQMARWSLSLDTPMELSAISSDGERRTSLLSTLYHGVNSFIEPPWSSTPSMQQPAGTSFRWTPVRPDGVLIYEASRTSLVRRRLNVPIAFDMVVRGGH